MNKIEKYGGYQINYDVEESVFYAELNDEDGDTIKAESLKALRAKIDKLDEEPKLKQPKQKAIVLETTYGQGWRYSSKERIVGAFGLKKRWSRSDSYDVYAWVTDANGRNRERKNFTDSYRDKHYQDTPANRKNIERIIALGKEITAFYEKKNAEQEALLEKLTTVEPAVARDLLPHWDR